MGHKTRRRNPLGLDLGTLAILGGMFYLFAKLNPANLAKDAADYLVPGVTTLGGTLPDGRPLNYIVDNLGWDSFLGITRAGANTFHVTIGHNGPADTPTVIVFLGRKAVGSAQITVPDDFQTQKYQAYIPVSLEKGVFPIAIKIFRGGGGGEALNQAWLEAITVYP